MTVSSQILSHSYIPGAAMLAESLAGLFAIDASDLVVTDSAGAVQVLGTDYTITGNLRTGTASIRTLRAYTAGVLLTITRATDREQKAYLPVGQPMPSVTIERELDRLMMIAQEQDAFGADLAGRSLRVPKGETIAPLPPAAARANHIQGYDGLGNSALYPPGVVDPALWQRFAFPFADALLASDYGTVEAAHTAAVLQGKKRVIVAGLAWVANGTVTTFNVPIEFQGGATCRANGFALTFAAGFRAGDYDPIFLPGDAGNLNFPALQRLSPFHFGAKGDYVSSASPGTDDTAALNAFASKLCDRWIPPVAFGITAPIYWNGRSQLAVQGFALNAEPGARFVQRTDNVPVLVGWGSRAQWNFPILAHENMQDATLLGGIGFLCCSEPGAGNGFYMNSVRNLATFNNSIGAFFPKAINSTLANSPAAGATTIQVADNQTDYHGGFPWMPGMIVQIEMNAAGPSGSLYHSSRITAVSDRSNVITFADPLPVASTAGKRVACGPTLLTTSGQAAFSPTRFSNTWSRVFIEQPTRAGWIDTGNGTDDVFVNRYVTDTRPLANQSIPLATLTFAIYESYRNGDKHTQTNIEHFKIVGDAWYISGDSIDVGSIHVEAVRLLASDAALGNTSGIIGGPVRLLNISKFQVVYCSVLSDDTANPCGLLVPRAGARTTEAGGKGVWTVGALDTAKNIFSPGLAFIVRDGSNNMTTVRIPGNWERKRDSGIYPYRQFSASTVNLGHITQLGSILPAGTVAYRLHVDMTVNGTPAQDMYPTNEGPYGVDEVLYYGATAVPTVATVGVWSDNIATVAVSSSGTTALSALTSRTGARVKDTVVAGEASKLRDRGVRLFVKMGTAEPAGAAKTVTSRYLTGRGGGNDNTNLAFINCTGHGLAAGNIVTHAGSSLAALNGDFYVVDVVNANQYVVYCDSVNAVGSAGAPTVEAGMTATFKPTFHAVAIGKSLPNL